MGDEDCGWYDAEVCVHGDSPRFCEKCPPPTLAEACEVIEALLGKGWRGHLSSWDDSVDRARGFLERVKGRHG